MGNTFSHFNILDSTVDEAIGLLNLVPKRPNILEIMKRVSPKNELWFAKSIDDIKKPGNANDEQWQQLRKDWPKALKYMNSQEREYWVGQNQNWTTAFSEEFGYESINEQTLPLSKKISNTFLTLGLFDDEVLALSVIKEGKILTHYVYGAERSDMKDSLGDINIFAKTFNIVPQKEKLEQILKNNNNDLDKKITELEDLLKFKLWINRSVSRELKWKKVVV